MTAKTILITGCSSGIGYDAAHHLKAHGWRVFATCRREEDCARLITEGLESFRLDYTDTGSISAAVAEVTARTGGTLDALFNNGAYAIPGALEDLPTDALRAIFETNLFGYHELTRQVLPIMRAQGHGRVLNCSSVLGYVTLKWRGAYNSTKFAMEGLSDTLRLEMRDTNIKVILIEPGPITSDIRKNSIPHFETWINWEGSPRAAQYRATLRPRLYDKSGPDRFELPASAVSSEVLKALQAPRPKARYRITRPARVMWYAKRMLSTASLDWLLARA